MPLVTSRLIGGLGNQMFQYAVARSIALRRQGSVRLDVSAFSTYTLRRFELDAYPIAARIEHVGKPTYQKRIAGQAARAFGMAGTLYFRERAHRYDPRVARRRLPLYLNGYWQSERYFVDCATTIRQDFRPREPLEPSNAATAAKIDEVEAVSLHVRRGDYVTDAAANAHHGTCTPAYYLAAIDVMRSRLSRPHLFVFSDDPEWTRANIVSDLPTTYVSANPPDRGFRDMQLMTRCSHHIIANSSFSWWGAWLNPNSNKIVIAPARWLASGKHDTTDLLPQTWLTI